MWYANYFAYVIPLSRLKAYYCTFLPFVLRIYFDHNIIPEFTFICPMWYIFRIKLLHKSDPIKWVPLFAHWVSYALSHHAILCGKDWFELVAKEERISTFLDTFGKAHDWITIWVAWLFPWMQQQNVHISAWHAGRVAPIFWPLTLSDPWSQFSPWINNKRTSQQRP